MRYLISTDAFQKGLGVKMYQVLVVIFLLWPTVVNTTSYQHIPLVVRARLSGSNHVTCRSSRNQSLTSSRSLEIDDSHLAFVDFSFPSLTPTPMIGLTAPPTQHRLVPPSPVVVRERTQTATALTITWSSISTPSIPPGKSRS